MSVMSVHRILILKISIFIIFTGFHQVKGFHINFNKLLGNEFLFNNF